jgi:hypothetical protein
MLQILPIPSICCAWLELHSGIVSESDMENAGRVGKVGVCGRLNHHRVPLQAADASLLKECFEPSLQQITPTVDIHAYMHNTVIGHVCVRVFVNKRVVPAYVLACACLYACACACACVCACECISLQLPEVV